jgi:DNA-binding transcriptional regulator/RsmH inhibitor MraZ
MVLEEREVVEQFFGGNAVCSVADGGRFSLPPFVLGTLDHFPAPHRLFFGCHESDPCLVGYGSAYRRTLFADMERRRAKEEAIAPDAHHGRARRIFGFLAEATIESDGSVELPPLMRRRAGIGRLALCVGTGGTFEIWDAERALDQGGGDLRELAAWHLELRQAA